MCSWSMLGKNICPCTEPYKSYCLLVSKYNTHKVGNTLIRTHSTTSYKEIAAPRQGCIQLLASTPAGIVGRMGWENHVIEGLSKGCGPIR